MNNTVLPHENKSFLGKFRSMMWNKRIYFLVFIIPVFVMYAVYALFKVHPFGSNSVLVLDLNGQYVYYYEAFRDFVHGGDEFFYNWSRNLSGEMFGVFAYYMSAAKSLDVRSNRASSAFENGYGGCGICFFYKENLQA